MTWYTITIAHQCNYLHHFHFITHCLFLISEEEFKRKLNTLRTQFTQEKCEVDKSRKSGAGTDELYTPKWSWFERLKFLWDVIGPKNI